jgi:D-alanyl-D-alanine dipeptidase
VHRAFWLALVACTAHAGTRPAGSEAAGSEANSLVEVARSIPDAVIDIRYATADNFTGKTLYPVARCKLRRAVVERLARAAKTLRADKRRLLIWDCYRPTSIQDVLWKLVPDERYVANPNQGSRHSRGAAVDVALVDADGKAVTLPTKFDEFSEAAHRDHALKGTAGVEARRLEAAMTAAGFVGMPTEWWHYDDPDATKYPLSNEPL